MLILVFKYGWNLGASFRGLCPLEQRAVGPHLFRSLRQAAQMSNLAENFYIFVYGPRQKKKIFCALEILYLPSVGILDIDLQIVFNLKKEKKKKENIKIKNN